MTWLTGWNYRKAITISNGGSVLTDYQVLVTVDTAALVTAGKLLSSCDDIRFTSSDGSTLLNYWIESGPNTSSTKIWVKIPSISSGSNIIYLYYNNTGASAASDGTNTFDFYEGFESYSNGTAIPGTWNYFYEVYNDAHYVTTADKNTGTKSYYLGTWNEGNTDDNWAFITLYSTQLTPREYLSLYSKGASIAYGSTGVVILFIRASTSVTIGYRLRVSYATQNGLDSYCDYNSGIAQTNKIHQGHSNYEIYLDNVGTSWVKALDNRNIKTDYETKTGDSWSNVQKIVIYLTAGTAVTGASGAAYAYYDDISLRKYVSPEPTITCIGGEEVSTVSWLSGWNRRKLLTITGSTSGAQTDYQMKIMAHKATGTDTSTDIYLGANIKNDFTDLRFTSSDGSTLLSHWIESYTSGSVATVWIKIPSVPIDPCTTTIYTYYDNSSATSASNGTNTFLSYTGFEEAGTPTGWSTWAGSLNFDSTAHVYQGSQSLTATTNGYATYPNITGSKVMEVMFYMSSMTYINTLFYEGESPNNNRGGGVNHSSAPSKIFMISNGTNYYGTVTLPTGVWYKMQYIRNFGAMTSSTLIYDANDTLVDSIMNKTMGTSQEYHMMDVQTTTWMDDFRVRKYTSPEPTFLSIGAEEIGVTATAMTITPSETPCRTGICTITATVTWQNLGSSSVTFRPKILIDWTTYVQATSDITIGAYPTTGSSSITTPTLVVGTHSICPSPN